MLSDLSATLMAFRIVEGRPTVIRYFPILKGKPGEFQAWSTASALVHDMTEPMFEVVPQDGVRADLTKFLRYAVRAWPAPTVLTYDAGSLDQDPLDDGYTPLALLSHSLHEAGIRARPVVHLDDDPNVLDEIAAVHRTHGEGVCIRAGSEEQDPDPDTCEVGVARSLARTGVAPSDIDIVFDLRAVDSPRTVRRVTPVATALIEWATSRPWRSVTVAAGAFPVSISNFPRSEQTALRRFDADLWRDLATRPHVPNFGDYGVAHPSIPDTQARGPLPNLRYTHGEEWWVWREPRALPGNESMRTLCNRVVGSAAFPGGDFSWGDGEVARVAEGAGGTGAATQWRAWGTSHHLAVVTDRLTTLSAP